MGSDGSQPEKDQLPLARSIEMHSSIKDTTLKCGWFASLIRFTALSRRSLRRLVSIRDANTYDKLVLGRCAAVSPFAGSEAAVLMLAPKLCLRKARLVRSLPTLRPYV